MKKVEKQAILEYFKSCIIDDSKENLSIELELDKSNSGKLFLPNIEDKNFDIDFLYSQKDINLFYEKLSGRGIGDEKTEVILENISELDKNESKKEYFFRKAFFEYQRNKDWDKKNLENKTTETLINFIKWGNNSLRQKLISQINNYIYFLKSNKKYIRGEDLEKLFFSGDNRDSLEKVEFFGNESFLEFYDKNKTEKIYICLENVITERNKKLIFQPLYFLEVVIEEDKKEHFFTISISESNVTFNFFIEHYGKRLFKLENKQEKDEGFELEKDIDGLVSFKSKIDLYKANIIKDFDKNKINKNPCLISANDLGFIKGLLKEYNELIEEKDLSNIKNTGLGILFDEANIEKNNIDIFTNFTLLNKEQQEAVKESLENKLSVIVGPPGTGKSQVVINIMLNAYINNKTVLFASKNNTAVDTVLKKVAELNLSYYPFLRLGSKIAQDEWYPKIKNKLLQDIKTYKIDFQGIIKIQDKIIELQRNIENIEKTYLNYYESYERLEIILNDYEKGFKEYIFEKGYIDLDFEEIENLLSEYTEIINRTPFQKIKEKIDIYFKISINFLRTILKFNKDYRKYHNNISDFIYRGYKIKTKLEKIKEKISDFLNNELDDILFDYAIGEINDDNFEEKLNNLLKLEEINIQKDNIEENFGILSKFKKNVTELNKELFSAQEKLKEKSLDYLSYQVSENVNDIKPRLSDSVDKIYNVFSFIKNWGESKDVYLVEKYKKLFDGIKIFITTNLSTTSIPLEKGFYDYLIIDEASQNDIASVVPLLYRVKNVIIIGDPNQLQNITTLKEDNIVKNFYRALKKRRLNDKDYAENFKDIYNFNNSVYSSFESIYKSKLNKPLVILKQHFRCHDDIINYSNFIIGEYNLFPKIYGKNQYLNGTQIPIGIHWIADIQNDNDEKIKINEKEAKAIIEYLKQILQILGDKVSIGIIAPFRNQVNYINKLIRDNKLEGYENILVDTVHKFQGDEKDIILFSTVYPNAKASTFLNDVNLLNVAVSRARNSFLIFGNKQAIKNYKGEKGEDLLYTTLIRYIDAVNVGKEIINYKKYDTEFEKQFFDELIKAGIKFDYQYPIYEGKYNLDFRIKLKGVNNYLNLELDGGVHNKQKSYDYTRNTRVEKLDYKVIRYSNAYMQENMGEIIEGLKKVCELEK